MRNEGPDTVHKKEGSVMTFRKPTKTKKMVPILISLSQNMCDILFSTNRRGLKPT